MNDVRDFFAKILDSYNWPARWHCGKWTPFHGWLYIVSNLVIAFAYFSIPLILFYLIRKSKNKLPFQKVFWLFLFFILACGFTHIFDALMFWYPVYRISALMLALTAIVSSAAVFGLYRIIPMALSLKSPAFLENIIEQRTSELASANQILSQTNHDLREAKLLAEKLLKQKDEFINIASHELKTPVTSLKMYTQLLSFNESGGVIDANAMYPKMDRQVNKLTKLINDLLDTSKLDQGLLAYHFEHFRLDEMLKEIIETVQITTSHKLIITAIEPTSVYADKLRIEQVVNNLLTNAIKFSPLQHRVEISLVCSRGLADENGEEVTSHISSANNFFASFLSFINQKKAKENLECIAECELLRISRPNLVTLIDNSENFKKFSLIIFEQAIASTEIRANDLATLVEEQRYKKLMETQPTILQHVPVQYIASFLGIKPQSLSRIRRKIIM